MGIVNRMDTLIIRLFSHTDTVDWIWLDTNQVVKESRYQADLSSCPHLTIGETIVLIPSTELLSTSVNIPPKLSTKHYRAAASSFLEDLMTDELENLHLALGTPNAEYQLPVIALNKSLMTEWSRKLREASIEPSQFIPDYFALPFETGVASIWMEKNLAVTRVSETLGFSIESTLVEKLLPAQINQIRMWDPAQILSLSNKQFGIRLEDQPKNYLEFWAKNLKESLNINLLQDEFAPVIHTEADYSQWIRWAGTVFATWLLFYIVGYGTEWLIFHSKNQALDNTISALYHEVFPNASGVISPKERIERELASVQHSGTQTDFLPMMVVVENVHQNFPDISIKEIEYSHSDLHLQVSAKDFEHLDKLSQALQKQGLLVKRENASTSTEGVAARFSLSGGAA